MKVKNRLSYHIENYQDCFQSQTADGHVLSKEYVFGLLKTEAGKRNMERINEELTLSGNGYERVQQFITDSPWSASRLVSEIALNTSRLYAEQWKGQGQDIGYIIDESAHIKKGKNSVGVARQYAGVLGKVENCQVGVYVTEVSRFPHATSRMTATMRGFRVPWPGSSQSTPKPTSARSCASARRTSAKAYSVRRAAA
jgi:SRSO17 transposase